MGYRPVATGPARHFAVTLGLREGYGTDDRPRVHTIAEVVAAHHAWQAAERRVLGVVVTGGVTSYGWPDGGELRGDAEPSATLAGVVNVLYQGDRADDEVLRDVTSLATFLGERFGQERVYLTCRDVALILERDKERT